MKLSIIIPAFNEEDSLPLLINDLLTWRAPGDEIIVVDGGSTDRTLERTNRSVDIVVRSEKGRARQMNAGAAVASGEMLWFVHADCRLSQIRRRELSEALAKGFLWGHFDVTIGGNAKLFRIIESFMNIRSRVTRIVTGDMGIFITVDLFNKIEGFPRMELMEDIEFSKKLCKIKPYVSAHRIVVSDRRWSSKGIIKTALLMWLVRLAWFFRVPTSLLVKIYD